MPFTKIFQWKCWHFAPSPASTMYSWNFFNEIVKNSNLRKFRPAKYKCYTVYMWSKVTAVSYLSAQKTSPNLVCCCVCIYMWPNLSATPGELHIKCYSSVFYLYAPIWSAPHRFMGSIYAHSYSQPILVCLSASAQCIQRTGLCVPWSQVNYCWQP